ncbi:CAP domain-containing protein [Shouchella miscanthi]|uniref:CAP domain-containing protein n=1 Tax=Shouchella miscanthi TaxID=2598861 RepID=UPI0011A9F0BD|nr:CAP domain-containing protein [Shouchella miscanthi]
MNKRLSLLMVLTVMLVILIYYYRQIPPEPVAGQFLTTKQPSLHMDYAARVTPALLTDDEVVKETDLPFDQHIGLLMGASEEEVLEWLGEPGRIDPSAFGYDTWVYNTINDGYLTVGVEDGNVTTVVANGAPIQRFLGEQQHSYEALNRMFLFEDRIPLEMDQGLFTFQLSEQDMEMRPLAQIGDYWIQFYMDVHTNQLSSVRLLSNEVLLSQQPYSFGYTNELPEKQALNPSELAAIDKANEKQIFELTNAIRSSFELEPFAWSDEVAKVAYDHSKDMYTDDYFDHVSPTFGTLSDRFLAGSVPFTDAGENIAYNYVDGIAAVEGWLNSDSHRIVLLHDKFTHLGVGVHHAYYTQNFLFEG